VSEIVNSTRTEAKSRVWWLLIILLTCSVVVNLLLGIRLSRLNSLVVSLATQSTNGLDVGATVPPIEARPLNGLPGKIEFGKASVPTVVYVFRPDCVWCARNLSNLRGLIASSGARYKIVGLSLPSESPGKDLTSYVEETRLKFSIYTDISAATMAAYHLGATPQTIVISPQSKVLKVWTGAYQGPILEDVQSYLRIKLPGCCNTTGKGS
jgi:peroxiredoxin